MAGEGTEHDIQRAGDASDLDAEAAIYQLTPEQLEKAKDDWARFTKRHGAWSTLGLWMVAAATVVTAAAVILIAASTDAALLDVVRGPHAGPLLFLELITMHFVMWSTYFVASTEDDGSSPQTLRRLLIRLSDNWNTDDAEETESDLLFIEKARSSILQTSIMTAASMVIATQSVRALEGLTDPWKMLSFLLAIAASATAACLFLVAVDALDSVFNRFNPTKNFTLTTRMYLLSTRPRYLGFVFLLTAVFFLVATELPFVAGSLVAVSLWAGNRHWFPRLNPDSKRTPEANPITPLWGVPLTVLPLVVEIISRLSLFPGVTEPYLHPAALLFPLLAIGYSAHHAGRLEERERAA